MSKKPKFVLHYDDIDVAEKRYPDLDEEFSTVYPVGKQAGLTRIGVNIELLPPKTRTCLPHAESDEEEFVFVLNGSPDLWIDGQMVRLREGDFVGLSAGTGLSHTIINNTDTEVWLVVGGESSRPGNKVVYPHDPEQNKLAKEKGYLWTNPPRYKQGPHSPLPGKLKDEDV